jgi:hypothetical protein
MDQYQMKISIILSIIIVLFTLSCKENKSKLAKVDFQMPTATVENKLNDTVIVASIGLIKITEQIIHYRLATESAYENTGLNKSGALIMLINDALEMELAEKYKQQALPDEIKQLKQHADQTSKAPDILKKVKAVFGQDVQAYDIWYISPKIVNGKIRDYFSANKSFNQAVLNQIKPAIKFLRLGKEMKAAAKLYNLTYSVDSIPTKPLNINPEVKNSPDAGVSVENPIVKYISKLRVGETYPEIIDLSNLYMIIKLKKQNKDVYLIERISIPKPDFDTWFRKEASNFTFRIYDAALKQEIQNNYGNLWWVRLLK